MKKTEHVYNLRVRPGIFCDGTFAVYAVPQENPNVEYQLLGQFVTEELASEKARDLMTLHIMGVKIQDLEVIKDRDVKLETFASRRAPEKQENAVREHLKEQFKAPETLKFRPFDRITRTTPHLLSYFALVVFGFSISFSVPTWIPILGDWIGRRVLTPSDFAQFYPWIILFCTIYLQFRVRKVGLQLAGTRDYVLTLALDHGWRREHFTELFLDVLENSPYSWARKLSEWVSQSTEAVFSSRIKDLEGKLGEDITQATMKLVQESTQILLKEDFEVRIHALYYMDKERNYRPWAVLLYPITFITNFSRASRQFKQIISHGWLGLLVNATSSLPGGYEYKVFRRMYPFIATYECLLFTVPLVWAFTKRPWEGILGWIGMGTLILFSVGPMLIWNYHLYVQRRGLPRGMPIEEIDENQRFIQAL